MENTLLARHSVYLFLFLTATLLLILSPLTGNAQTPSTVEGLAGTSWQGTISSGTTVTTFTYVFTEDGKVKETTHWEVNGLDVEQVYNHVTHRWELILKPLPTTSGGGDTVCKYKRDGDSIQFHCYDRVWNATIQGNHMEGNIILSQGTPNEKTLRWSIERIVSPDKRQLAESLSIKAKNLVSQAGDLRTKWKILESQGKYREAIDALSTVIETELDTKQYVIEAYIERALIKLGLKDYTGAIEDCSRAIQLSTPFKKKAMEMRAEAKSKAGSHDSIIVNGILEELRKKEPEVSAAMDGLSKGYEIRSLAKKILGDEKGADDDLRLLRAFDS